MAELKTVLGFEAAGAIATLKQMETALLSWTSAMKKAGVAASTFNRNSGRVEGAFRRVGQTAQTADVQTRSYYSGITKGSKSATTAVVSNSKKQEDAGKRVLLSWQSVVRIFAIQVIHQAVTKITNALWEGVSAARDFEISLAEIQTIGVAFRANFEGLADQVRAFSDATGAPLEGVAEGVYQTLSNQVADTSEAFTFMANTQAFATATMTTAADSVDLFSSVINSYNLEIREAAEIGGKLAKIIDLGRIRGEEFANTFGRITVLASQLGITFDEVGASVATLTVTGLKYNEASTLMLNIMLKLIRPTEELSKRYRELGITSSEAGIQAFGFQGFLDKLAEKAGTSATELGKLFNRVRAIRGVMGLANENAKVYAENLEAIRAAGADELFEKRDIIFKTNAKQVELELNRLRNLMVDGFGREVNAALLAIFDTFGGAIGTMKALAAGVSAAAVALLLLKANAIASAIALGTLSTAFPPLLIITAAALAATAIASLFTSARDEAEKTRNAFEEANDLAFRSRLRQLDDESDAQKENNKKALSEIQKYLFGRKKVFDEASKALLKVEKVIFEDITTRIGNKIQATTAFFDNLQQRAASTILVIRDLNAAIGTVKLDIIDFNFSRALQGLAPIQKANKQLERSADFRRQAFLALHRGEIELSKSMSDRAKSSAQAALSAADESHNRTAIRRAELAIRAIYKDEIVLLEKKKQSAVQEKKVIESASEQIVTQRRELQLLNVEILSTVKEFDKVRFNPVKREETITKLKSLVRDAEVIFDSAELGFGLPSEAKIVADFRAVLGQGGEISTLVAAALNNLTKQLNALTAAKSIADIKLQKLLPGATTLKEQQAAIVELENLLDKSADATIDRAEAEHVITRGLNTNVVLLEKIRDAYADSASSIFSIEGFSAVTRNLLGATDIVTPLQDAKEKADQARFAMDLVTEAVRLLQAETLDLGVFKGTEEALSNLAAAPGTAGEVQVAIRNLLENLHELEIAKLALEQDAISILSPQEKERIIQDIQEITDAIGEEFAAASDIGRIAVVENARLEVTAISTITEAYRQRNIAAAGNNSVRVKESRFGGLLYRADGGWTPRGTDRIPAMLSRGEYVVDAGNTRKFYSQLVAISNGVQPIYRAAGGPVTNIGDVNITVNETVSAQQTARETIRAFRRQTRRGAATL